MRYLFILLLTSCAAFEPKIITKEIKVPVSVPCVKEIPVKPELLSPMLRKEDTIFRKSQVLLIDNNALRADNLTLRALLEGCK